MRKGTVLNLNRLTFLNSARKNKSLIFLSFIFLLGIILGIIFLSKSDTTLMFSKFTFENFLFVRLDKPFWKILLKSLFYSLVHIFLMFVCGTSFVGIVLTPVLTLIKGYLYGGFLAYIYVTYLLKGIAFNAVIFLPSAIIFTITFLFCAKLSLGFSYELLGLTFKENYNSPKIYTLFKNYCSKYLLNLIFVLISSLIDSLFSIVFLHYFDF